MWERPNLYKKKKLQLGFGVGWIMIWFLTSSIFRLIADTGRKELLIWLAVRVLIILRLWLVKNSFPNLLLCKVLGISHFRRIKCAKAGDSDVFTWCIPLFLAGISPVSNVQSLWKFFISIKQIWKRKKCNRILFLYWFD